MAISRAEIVNVKKSSALSNEHGASVQELHSYWSSAIVAQKHNYEKMAVCSQSIILWRIQNNWRILESRMLLECLWLCGINWPCLRTSNNASKLTNVSMQGKGKIQRK